MLTINNQQMQVFERAQLQGFVQRVLTRLELACGQAHGWVANDVLQGLEAARGFGLEHEAEVADFIEVSCHYLPPLPALPLTRANWPVPALAILCSHGLAPNEKIRRYRAWASAWDRELP
ncbi:hypothetical protein [Pseudomonas sp. zfem002]|uniref:hypothetical protein n=1 Tax=Pseudomonas sp. zfem002 TaxID=3078197 RepID=UPI00292A3B4B|nr:hypothetical protein [Pseudomonas sp. zfem002]MDU9393336.1 hypothetical protein [Pseudomonas sp. zfem002]